jgi:hypothetical protein
VRAFEIAFGPLPAQQHDAMGVHGPFHRRGGGLEVLENPAALAISGNDGVDLIGRQRRVGILNRPRAGRHREAGRGLRGGGVRSFLESLLALAKTDPA